MESKHTHTGALHTAGGLCHGVQVSILKTNGSLHLFCSVKFTSHLLQPLPFLLLCSFQEPQEEEDDEEDEEDEEEKAPNPPMMVPMADMLNHVSNHNANLEFTPVRRHIHFLSHV